MICVWSKVVKKNDSRVVSKNFHLQQNYTNCLFPVHSQIIRECGIVVWDRTGPVMFQPLILLPGLSLISGASPLVPAASYRTWTFQTVVYGIWSIDYVHTGE